MLGRMSRVGEGARVLLGLIRLVNGTAAMVAPEPIGRRLGIEPEENPAASYVTRLFGIRTMLIGYDLLQRDPCDLVVTDVEMPRMDGFSLTARVRADERLRGLPVVLVTSLDSEEDRRRGVEVGADAYIVKGAFDQDRLLETIRRLI